MRARQRHLNKSLRDSACAFDARFLSGFSDGNTVETWTDLSGNARDASQSTAANRPTYKTAIQGGNPILRFDGSNDTMTTAAFDSPSELTAVIVAKANSWTDPSPSRCLAAHGYVAATAATSGISLGFVSSGPFADWQKGDFLCWGDGYQSTQNPRAIGPSASGSDFRVISVVFWSTRSRAYQNGVSVSTRVETTGTIDTFSRAFQIGIGDDPVQIWLGDIAAILYFRSNTGDALRVRLERSNALSFKIACS
jgi:hypothetical protein